MTLLEQATTNVFKELKNTTWVEQKYHTLPKTQRAEIEVEFAIEKLLEKQGFPTLYLIARDKISSSYIYIAEVSPSLKWVPMENSQYYESIKHFAELVISNLQTEAFGLNPIAQSPILKQIAEREFKNYFRP